MTRLALILLAAAACGIPQNNPGMEPGQDCMSCHASDSTAGGRPWTAAGTLFAAPDSAADAGVSGGRIFIQDAIGRTFTLTTNAAGNFYTAEALAFPLAKVQAEVNGVRMAMVGQPKTGSCNSCHTNPPGGDAPGRLFVPAPVAAGSK